MRKVLFILSIFIVVASQLYASPKAAYTWALLDDGILYAKHSFEISPEDRITIHAFMIDPAKSRMEVIYSDAAKQPLGMTAKDFAKEKNANIVINGGFFTEERKSIGLLVNKGKVINPSHRTSWWSIFGLKDGVPFIETLKGFKLSSKISMAVQAGPRLVIKGTVPKLKTGVAPRSAVGITQDGRVILVATEGSAISLNELAAKMKDSRFEGGLECVDAMALDGGSSSQIYAAINKFELSVPGVVTVPNGIAVYTK